MLAATNAQDTLYNGLGTLVNFVPRLIGAVIILVIGWIIAGFVGKIVEKVLNKIGADRLTKQAGVDAFAQRAGVKDFTAGGILGTVATWWIRLMVLEVAADALGVAAVTKTLDSLVSYLPNIFVAVVLVLVGAYVAKLAKTAVSGAAQGAGLGSAQMLGTVAQSVVLVLFMIAALEQIHVAETLVNELTITALAIIAGSSILAFGLGGREAAAHLIGAAYKSGSKATTALQGSATAPDPRVGATTTPAAMRDVR